MEGTAFFYMALIHHQNLRRSQSANHPPSNRPYQPPSITRNKKNRTANHSKVPHQSHLPSAITTKFNKLKSRLLDLNPWCKMPTGLLVLHVPSNPRESPQFVRLARKGIGMSVVFLHPNGQLYKVPHYSDLKGYERDCGPQTAPVMGGAQRTCEGGCCAWFTVDVDDDGKDVLDKLDLDEDQELDERPKHDVFLVRHGSDGDAQAKTFMHEGLEHIKKDGRGWLGKARLYKP